MRIRFETDAFYLILEAIKNSKYQMIVSQVHFREIKDIKDLEEHHELLSVIESFGHTAKFDIKKTRERAEELYSLKFGVADAAHLAIAENTADYFITCDDKLLRKSRKLKPKIKTLNLIEFCIEEDLR